MRGYERQQQVRKEAVVTYIARDECKRLLEDLIEKKIRRIQELYRLIDFYRNKLPDSELVRRIYYEQYKRYLDKNVKDLVALISKLSAINIYDNAICIEDDYGRIDVRYIPTNKK